MILDAKHASETKVGKDSSVSAVDVDADWMDLMFCKEIQKIKQKMEASRSSEANLHFKLSKRIQIVEAEGHGGEDQDDQ